MHAKKEELPVALDGPEGKVHMVDWGTMTVEMGTIAQRIDLEPYFEGLPDNRCQCPHWGYVIRGRLRYKTATGEEVFNAGEAYYVAPGHTPVMEAGTEYVEFSPAAELAKTAEVVLGNMAKEAASHA